jgi:hypothetical protein
MTFAVVAEYGIAILHCCRGADPPVSNAACAGGSAIQRIDV